uniref:aspartate/glutamate racemase family protein n=1 Tax=Parerythrobacter lutipelagi TaxID=1964208 RepID=UPI0010F5B5D7|nr:amino acid racemase [Parerythrobacter lutipelagi]
MRKLGMIGGMSWVSTRTYYETINRAVQKRTDAMSSAPLLIESLDFRELYGLHSDEDWDRASQILVDSAQRLEAAGAEGLIIAANSMHRVYDKIVDAIDIPVLHIADCVGRKMASDGMTNAALIGTRNVMTESFYRQRLVSHGVDLLPPDMVNVEILDRFIYDQLMVGKATRDAERALKTIITQKEQAGAKAIVLACTELEMVVDVNANVLPIYDSARIHCGAAADWIFGQDF